MTKDERAARKEFRKAFSKALNAAARSTRFKTANGCLYDDRDGWFLAIAVFPDPGRTRTWLVAYVKPMGIDTIFWDAMGIGERRRRPLWRRHLGIAALRAPPFAEHEFNDDNQPEAAAAHILDRAETWSKALVGLPLADYLNRCRTAEKHPFHYFGSIATTLIAMGRKDEALELCHAAMAAGNSGGYRAQGRHLTQRLAELIEQP